MVLTRRPLSATPAAKQFIYERLTSMNPDRPSDELLAVAQLSATPVGSNIHPWPVDDDIPLPLITWTRQNSTTVGPIGSRLPSAAETILFMVYAECEGDDDGPILEAADLMKYLLDGSSQTIIVPETGVGYAIQSIRTGEIPTDLPAEDDGTVYQRLGGLYELIVTRI
jgi:hypothetical protein